VAAVTRPWNPSFSGYFLLVCQIYRSDLFKVRDSDSGRPFVNNKDSTPNSPISIVSVA